ncbi:hypothetical protein EV426DRAFT_713277 [Tirmania nivea]|nr:hypothetical protein EV426DRAFT_713277 [Tirmania nivea]
MPGRPRGWEFPNQRELGGVGGVCGVVLFASVVLPHECVHGPGIGPGTKTRKVVEYDKVKGGIRVIITIITASIEPARLLRDCNRPCESRNSDWRPAAVEMAHRRGDSTEPHGDVDAVRGQGRDHCTGARGEGDELNGEWGGVYPREDFVLQDVQWRRKVLGDVAHPEGAWGWSAWMGRAWLMSLGWGGGWWVPLPPNEQLLPRGLEPLHYARPVAPLLPLRLWPRLPHHYHPLLHAPANLLLRLRRQRHASLPAAALPLVLLASDNPHFSPHEFLASLHNRHQTLEDLRLELRNRSTELERELVELVEGEYADFVGLGRSLGGGEGKEGGGGVGWEGEGGGREVGGGLSERRRVRAEKEVVRKLLGVARQLDDLEVLLLLEDAPGGGREDFHDHGDDGEEGGGMGELRRLEKEVDKFLYADGEGGEGKEDDFGGFGGGVEGSGGDEERGEEEGLVAEREEERRKGRLWG